MTGDNSDVRCCRTIRTKGCSGWCKKFFWEGQKHNKAQQVALEKLDHNTPLFKRLLVNHRRALGFILPGAFVHIFWWALFIKKDLWGLYDSAYPMVITMVFGSLIAGLTSEGGGAIAFPVMTLVLSIKPTVARDFSMMIQAFGMTCAALSIIIMRVKVNWASIIFSSLGGWPGMVFGFYIVDPAMSPQQKKMFFVSTWFGFAFALFMLNRYHKRRTFDSIPDLNVWKIFVLIVTGFVGGIFTSFAGSGLDICSFSMLTLLFRLSEKVATPTSVVLMGGASVFGFYWRHVMMGDIDQLAWDYMGACIPIVVIGAPCGALIGSHFHRLVLAALIYIVDTTALIGAFVVIPQTAVLGGVSAAIIIGAMLFFVLITFIGNRLLRRYEQREEDGMWQDSKPPAVDEPPPTTNGTTSPAGAELGYANGTSRAGGKESGYANGTSADGLGYANPAAITTDEEHATNL